MKRILLLVMAATISMGVNASQVDEISPRASLGRDDNAPLITPTETCLFAHRDTCDLYLDIYEPAPSAETTFQGIQKPTLIFAYGGGFIIGKRDEPYYFPWLKQFIDNGYRVVAIDYRLGLKGVDLKLDLLHLFESCRLTKKAVDMGVEDVFSAVKFLVDEKGVDPSNIVVMGNSAGAMISLSAELEACNGWSGTGTIVEISPRASLGRDDNGGASLGRDDNSVISSGAEKSRLSLAQAAGLPEGFHFKGVMAFAGAIMTVTGVPTYSRTPAPHLLIHGDNDGAVTFTKSAFGKYGMYGSSALVKDVFAKKGYTYHFYRFLRHSHDMASNMFYCMKEQFRFLEEEVMLGRGRTIDVKVDDPEMPIGEDIDLSKIYG